MGATEQPRPKDKRGRRWLFVTGAVLLVLAIPACFPYLQGNEGCRIASSLLWDVACIYLVALVLWRIARRLTRRRKEQSEAAAGRVQWMLGRSSSSPSRAEAMRRLPKYCMRLLDS
jgi:hypothetical protein